MAILVTVPVIVKYVNAPEDSNAVGTARIATGRHIVPMALVELIETHG